MTEPPFWDSLEVYGIKMRRKMRYLLKVIFELVVVAILVGIALWWLINYYLA